MVSYNIIHSRIVIFLILLFSFVKLSWSQRKYAVLFTDKNNSTYSIDHPQSFLSPKAITRRVKQNVPIDFTDLPVNRFYIDSISNTGANFIYSSKWLNLAVVEVIDTTILETISDFPFVEEVRLIKREEGTGKKKYKKHKFSIESDKKNNYGSGNDQITMLEGNFLHNLGYRGEGITIAVLDAGFSGVNQVTAFNHLWDESRILGKWNFVNNNDSVFSSSSHGTQVLSTMATNVPNQLVGTSPNASFWLLQTEDVSSETVSEEYNWLAGAEFADSVGADIINSSLSYTTFDDSTQNHTYEEMDGITTVVSQAASIAASKGILVVNSAGNSGNDPWEFVGAPADASNILSVGAVDRQGNYESFSSRGPTFDGRIKPNVVAMGRQSAVVNSNGEIIANNGTSFSSPIVAGMIACLWQAFPNKTNVEIMDGVQKSAHQYSNSDNLLGYGIPNFKLAHLLFSGLEVDKEGIDELITIFPQPFIDDFSLVYYSAVNQVIDLEITNVTGKLIYKTSKTIRKELIETISLESPVLLSGIYFLRVKSSSGTIIKRIVRR